MRIFSKCSWDGQGHLARKLLIQKSHMLFSSNPGTRDFGLGKKHAARQDFESEFKSFKPCIHGSDAHDYNSLFEPAEGRHLSIKACLTFRGLQQLLHEPAGRVHMGNEPPCLLRMTENATKYISIINFEPTQQAQQGKTRFSGKVLLNHGLVAIIGTRVAGRVHWPTSLPCSATHRVRRTSPSSNKSRFLTPKTKLGSMFRATVRWHSRQGSTVAERSRRHHRA